MGVSGSIRKVLHNGLPLDVAADANPNRTPSQENEGVRHSGGVSKKVTSATGMVEGLKLIIDDADYETVQGLSEGPNFAMSYEKADGSVLRTVGFINLGNHEAEENSCEITMTPETGRWDVFAA